MAAEIRRIHGGRGDTVPLDVPADPGGPVERGEPALRAVPRPEPDDPDAGAGSGFGAKSEFGAESEFDAESGAPRPSASAAISRAEPRATPSPSGTARRLGAHRFLVDDPGISTARDEPRFRSLSGVENAPDPQAGKIVSRWLGRFTLESGAVIPDLVVAYRHDGVPIGEGRQILVVHALTGSADAAGDWWAPIIGEGAAIDTDKYGVLCANLLGSRYGTSGPTSRNPVTGKLYGKNFPRVTVRDQARAQWRLLDALGIGKLALAAGGSLGGMVALEVALERPGEISRVLPIAAPARIGQLAIGWNHIQLDMIDKLGADGLDLARQLAMTTYRSEVDFEQRFAGRAETDGTAAVVSYLRHQGEKLLERFDPETYRTLVRAMDSHDIGRDRGGPVAAMQRLAAYGTRLTGVGIEGDILYGTNQVREMVDAANAAGMDAAYREIRSNKGHDAFLVEWEQLTSILTEALK
jgi:homoserine O-acetyltransferase/O-succinyltransferase